MAPAEDLRQVLASADDFGIGKRRAVELLAEVVKGISSWKKVARMKGVGMSDRDVAAYAPHSSTTAWPWRKSWQPARPEARRKIGSDSRETPAESATGDQACGVGNLCPIVSSGFNI